jgi:hypothetical protein
MSDKQQADKNISLPTIQEEISKYSKMDVREYTTTLYDVNGKLIDDEITMEDESTYWESFVGSRQASELIRRLALVEDDDYEEDSIQFEQMEDEDE